MIVSSKLESVVESMGVVESAASSVELVVTGFEELDNSGIAVELVEVSDRLDELVAELDNLAALDKLDKLFTVSD